MIETVTVTLVGIDETARAALASDGGFDVETVADLGSFPSAATEPDAIVVAVDAAGPLDVLRRTRELSPDTAVIVVTDPANEADGAVAGHAGAEDHLVGDELLAALLPRAIRYAVASRRMRRELATIDDVTGLPNLRGFAAIAEHHLRMADRAEASVVFVFVRLDGVEALRAREGARVVDDLARDAAGVVLDAVRSSDVPARISDDTICVLLTGDAEGAETVVLSRLVEAIAVHDAARDDPRSLSLSVGTARYDPGSGAGLADIVAGAFRGLSAGATGPS